LFLNCLLTLRLTLFILSTLLWLGSCIHCSLACFVWSKKSTHSLWNYGLCCFHLCRHRLPLAKVLIFSLMFSHALLMFSSPIKFTKAGNLFLIPIWYFSLTPSSFSFLRLNLSPSNLFAACLRTALLLLLLLILKPKPWLQHCHCHCCCNYLEVGKYQVMTMNHRTLYVSSHWILKFWVPALWRFVGYRNRGICYIFKYYHA